jgi:hypothetical protein
MREGGRKRKKIQILLSLCVTKVDKTAWFMERSTMQDQRAGKAAYRALTSPAITPSEKLSSAVNVRINFISSKTTKHISISKFLS